MSDSPHPDPVIQFAQEIKQLIANVTRPLEQRIVVLERLVDELKSRLDELDNPPH